MIRSLILAAACTGLLFAPGAAVAQAADPASNPAARAPGQPAPDSTTQHSVTILAPDGSATTIDYRATAGTIPVLDDNGKTKAHMFYVAYSRLGPAAPDGTRAIDPSRPITFTFNGGPGSSSVWLHMGTMGPRRVQMGPEGEEPLPPGKVINNDHSWLDMTDLVFIDPVSTGFSRAVEGEDPKQFHGLDEDIRAVGEFIRLYTTRAGRWASPKFLVGESYGTTRAAGLSGYLQDRAGMYLNGIVLVSPVLNFQTIRFDVGNDEPFWLYLPAYTATAWFHGKLGPELQADLKMALAQSEGFAVAEYRTALMKGDSMPPEERERVARNFERLTGISRRFVERSNFRVDLQSFLKELLRDKGRTVGRLDSRFTGIDRNDVGGAPEYDPSMSAILGPYTAGLNAYMRGELNYHTDMVYEILTGRVQPWSFAPASNRYANVAETLRSAMNKNPSLKVLVACGYYDLATPYFAARHTISHMLLDPARRSNITFAEYESGHMMYIREADLKKFKDDARAFYESALRPTP